MEKIKVKREIQKLIESFQNDNVWQRREEHIQSLFTLELLKLIGFKSSNFTINEGQDVKTGKKPDILIKNDSGSTLLVIESKDASKKDMLDGRYGNKSFIEQLFGYCKGEGLYWGILTNFVEWRLYSVYQNRLYKERKYAFHKLLWANADHKDYIDLLSDEGLNFLEKLSKDNLVKQNGLLDTDTVYYPKQDEIKEKFFNDLKRWRANLRSYLTKKYTNKYDLNIIDLITQKLLDRLIFIDYCSDNQIISQAKLSASLETKGNLHNELKKIFQDMDEKFNSELFAHNECDNVIIDDDIIRPIIIELSNIDFNKLSVHVIGEVYENYLGELLKAGKRGVKVVEERASQKKKSQGIYYTPEYIVNYIIQNTVGKILEKCSTIQEVENIKVLDPACGSGSFLIKVFDEFLKHYERIQPTGMFEFEVRKKILQKNIYAVDLDERAVEIAKLNLMIKSLENSSHANLKGRKLLPNLKLNIRCGNSLVAGNFDLDDPNLFSDNFSKTLNDLLSLHYKFHQTSDEVKKEIIYNEIMVSEEIFNRSANKELHEHFSNVDELKPFNYPIAFPEVFINGGFDCIIGNPPYIGQKDNKKAFEPFKVGRWKDYYERKQDIYYYFYIKGAKLLKKDGFLSFITPQYWLTAFAASKLRKYLSSTLRLTNIFDVSGTKVFTKANINTMVFNFQKNTAKNSSITINFYEGNKLKSYKSIIPNAKLSESEWNLFKNNEYVDIIKKSNHIPLGSLCTISPGIQTGCDKVSASHLKKYNLPPTEKGAGIFVLTEKEVKNIHSSGSLNDYIKPWYKNSDIGRYYFNSKNESWGIITNKIADITNFPELQKHLGKFKKIINDRFINYALKKAYEGGKWWFLYGYRPDTDFENDKIIFSYRNSIPKFSYSDQPFYSAMDIYYITNLKKDYSYKFILGILNSKLLKYYFDKNCKKKGTIIEFSIKPMSQIPIPKITANNSHIVEKIISLVDEMLVLHKQIDNKIKISAVDKEIDDLIFKLYNLTPGDIDIINQKLQ